MFTHLHGHSHYSLLEAIGTPKAIVAAAKEAGMEAIALTDYNGMYGIIEFYEEAKKQGIKPLLGVELGLVQDIKLKEKNEDAGTLVLLACSYDGYQNLLQLVSHANLEGRNGKARIDFDLLERFGKDIITIMGGPNSRLGKKIIQEESSKKLQELVEFLQKIVGKENVILELTAQDEKKLKHIRSINKAIYSLAEKTESFLVIAPNFHYPRKDDAKAFEVALAIKDGRRIYDEKRRDDGERYIMSEEEVRTMMEHNGYDHNAVETWITTTNTIAQRCTVDIPLGRILFPRYESPQEIKDLYETMKDTLVSSD